MKLIDIVPKSRACIHQGFSSWQEAVGASCQPLIQDGSIDPSYVTSIVDCINKYGPYIVIAPDICIPHAQEGDGVNRTSVGFMKTFDPVNFSDDVSARLFFVLASANSDEHMENIQKIAEYLSDEEFVQSLLNAKSLDDIYG